MDDLAHVPCFDPWLGGQQLRDRPFLLRELYQRPARLRDRARHLGDRIGGASLDRLGLSLDDVQLVADIVPEHPAEYLQLSLAPFPFGDVLLEADVADDVAVVVVDGRNGEVVPVLRPVGVVVANVDRDWLLGVDRLTNPGHALGVGVFALREPAVPADGFLG